MKVSRDQPWIVQALIDDVVILAPLVLDNHGLTSSVDSQRVDAPAVTLAGGILRGEEIDAGQGAQVLLEELLQPAFVGEGIARKLVDVAVNLVKEPHITHPASAPDALLLTLACCFHSERRRSPRRHLERDAPRPPSGSLTATLVELAVPPYSGSAKTNSVLPLLGRSSGVSRLKAAEVSERPVLTATYWRPSWA